MKKRALKMTSFSELFFSPADPKSEKNPVKQLIKTFWPNYKSVKVKPTCIAIGFQQ